MDEIGNVNIFLSEGAGVPEIIQEIEEAGERGRRATRSATCRLDTINPGAWFAKQFAERLGAEKVMVQKSGYFSRSAARQRRGPAPHQVDDRPTPSSAPCAARPASSATTRRTATASRRSSSRASRATSRSTSRSRWYTELLADIGQP